LFVDLVKIYSERDPFEKSKGGVGSGLNVIWVDSLKVFFDQINGFLSNTSDFLTEIF
jgi:hypothetical protein